jgi:hypothetical protein
MKTYLDYVSDAANALDHWSGDKVTAKPTQLQTINLALVMAISDLITALQEKK